MDKFRKGEKAYSTLIGKFVWVLCPSNYHTPTLYVCKDVHNEKEYALYEPELMTVLEHDKHFGLIPDTGGSDVTTGF